VRRLAATVLYELSQEFDLHLDPTQAVHNNVFMGIHLRTSTDAAVRPPQAQPRLQLSLQIGRMVEFRKANKPLSEIRDRVRAAIDVHCIRKPIFDRHVYQIGRASPSHH
jgi:hypothetical protein